MSDNVALILDVAITQKIQKSWEAVFKASSKIIQQSGLYGFDGMELIPNPNIHQMLRSLKIVSVMLTEIVDRLESLEIGTDEVRLLCNAQEQIARMERVSLALISNDRELFDLAIQDLESQACF
ncbi:MAG: hypothetical protein PHW66_06300 [Gallionella sp.]|nr:hypothetical protein [Gallionella sp.]